MTGPLNAMSLAGFLVRDHCQKCKLMWNVATTAGVFKLLISLACVITLIAQFWSGCFRASAHLVLSLYIFPFADPISVENCLRWALMTGLRRFAIYSGGIFPKVGWTHGKSQQCPGTNLLFQRGSDWQTKKTSSFLSIKLVTIWAQADAIQKIDRYSPEKKNLFNG